MATIPTITSATPATWPNSLPWRQSFSGVLGMDLGGAAPLGLWAEMIGELCRDLPAPPLDSIWPSILAPIAPDLQRQPGQAPGRRVSASPELERARLFE